MDKFTGYFKPRSYSLWKIVTIRLIGISMQINELKCQNPDFNLNLVTVYLCYTVSESYPCEMDFRIPNFFLGIPRKSPRNSQE